MALAIAAACSMPAQGRQPRVITVADGLDFPTSVAFGSDGQVYVNERSGAIRVVRDGRLQERPLATIPTITSGETGLLDSAVSPDGADLYVFATAPGGSTNRVLRVPLSGGNPEVVVDGLPAATYHNGGGVAFDLDGMLLVGNGEQHDASKAQDPQQLGGKIYRFTPSGGIPDDNPFGDSPTFALGLRNPFGVTVDPQTGVAWATENGPEAHDELNRVVEGGNYGWPVTSGPAAADADLGRLPGNYHDPVIDYEDIIVPTGITFAPGEAPAGVAGDLFFGAYGQSSIHRVRLNPARTQAASDEIFLRSDQPVIGVGWGPRGLYFTTTDAVKLIPAAVFGEAPAPPGDASTATPGPGARSPSATGDEDEPSPWLAPAVGLGFAALLASGYLLARRRR